VQSKTTINLKKKGGKMENNISAQENLDYIKSVMLDSKNMIKDNGIMAIIWGTIIIGAQLINFFMIRLESYSNISMGMDSSQFRSDGY
jgi:hypothetical protein